MILAMGLVLVRRLPVADLFLINPLPGDADWHIPNPKWDGRRKGINQILKQSNSLIFNPGWHPNQDRKTAGVWTGISRADSAAQSRTSIIMGEWT